VLDDFLLAPPNVIEAKDLLEVIDDRSQLRSTLVVSQLPVENGSTESQQRWLSIQSVIGRLRCAGRTARPNDRRASQLDSRRPPRLRASGFIYAKAILFVYFGEIGSQMVDLRVPPANMANYYFNAARSQACVHLYRRA